MLYHLVTRLMRVTDLLQVVPTRLIQAVRNKLLRACCHQLVNNLLRADEVRLVGTTCCESVDLINLFQTCPQLGTSSPNTSVRCLHIYWCHHRDMEGTCIRYNDITPNKGMSCRPIQRVLSMHLQDSQPATPLHHCVAHSDNYGDKQYYL